MKSEACQSGTASIVFSQCEEVEIVTNCLYLVNRNVLLFRINFLARSKFYLIIIIMIPSQYD